MSEQIRDSRFVCPRCGRASSHPKDKAEGYCGACHDWTGEPRMTSKTLQLERKDQPNETPFFSVGAADGGPTLMLTPSIDEDYWSYRVRLTETQAVVGFPKFMTVGIGFAQEEDWNTNLPYTCTAAEIYDHIAHNAGDDAITREDVLAAIRLIQQAVVEDRTESDGACM